MTQPEPAVAAPAEQSRAEQQAILTVTCLAAFLFFNSFGSIGVALPMIQKQFGNSLSAVQWVSLMGVVTISSLSFCFGRAGSIFGQRRLYKIGVALYPQAPSSARSRLCSLIYCLPAPLWRSVWLWRCRCRQQS